METLRWFVLGENTFFHKVYALDLPHVFVFDNYITLLRDLHAVDLFHFRLKQCLKKLL